MSKSKTAACLTSALLAGVVALPLVRAADDTRPANPAVRVQVVDKNGNTVAPRAGGGQQIGPEQVRKWMLTSYQKRLGATDAEFAAIQPKLEKVMDLQSQVAGVGFGWGGQAQDTPVAAALKDLEAILVDKDAKPKDIEAKLVVLRDARTKAKEDLAKAQEDLKSVLSARQEALLVVSGTLQ